jgi:3-keto-disaccharide hydrolase
MKRRWMAAAWLALGWLAPAIAGAAQKPASEGEWVSLFDGKSIDDWTVVPLPGKKTKWEVKDGVIEGTGEASMLYSPRGDYQNFRFRAEVKINDKGNSGMYVRAPKEATFSKGYEIQVNSTHADPIKTGSLYTLVHLYKIPVPPDTWFTQEVEVTDVNYRGKIVTKFRISVNGELLYEYLDHDRLWKTGAFAFQQHDPGSKVSIRKVEVIELPATKEPVPKAEAKAKAN